jgi:hypothetical protein
MKKLAPIFLLLALTSCGGDGTIVDKLLTCVNFIQNSDPLQVFSGHTMILLGDGGVYVGLSNTDHTPWRIADWWFSDEPGFVTVLSGSETQRWQILDNNFQFNRVNGATSCVVVAEQVK